VPVSAAPEREICVALATFQLALMPKSGREVSEVTARVGGASWGLARLERSRHP